MKNIFIQLKGKAQLKQEQLLKMLDIDPEEDEVPEFIENYFEQEEEHNAEEASTFIISLINKYNEAAFKEKLYAILVFYAVQLPLDEISKVIDWVEGSTEPISTKVRFFSLVYKSSGSNELKKRLITSSINLIEKETKISIFSNFVQNFDSLISTLTFNHNEYVKMYLKLINYLEKHVVYKKLWKHYIVQCLSNVASENIQSAEVDSLIVKLLKSSEVSEETVSLLHYQPLAKNQLYPYLQALLFGDFERFNKLDKKLLENAGISHAQLERRVKIEAIPRALSRSNTNVQVVSYQQISELLHIQKEDVESYIIEAIHEGIVKAKIDESSETIIINSVKFRTLRAEERASLQKNLSTLASRLQELAGQ